MRKIKMKKYKIWYDAIEEKYYLKFDGENKIEVTKKQFLLLEEEINIVAEAIIKQGYPCVESLAERIRRNNKMKNISHIGRIKVLLYDCENEFESVCECPHCSSEVLYGDMMMVSGIHCCPKCNEEVNRQIKLDKEADYNVYVRKANGHEYEPYRYREEK